MTLPYGRGFKPKFFGNLRCPTDLSEPASITDLVYGFLAIGARAIANSLIIVRTPLLPRRGFQTSDYFL
ncbi:MAG: hypothetical protein F6K63_24080 [Moorea sp. SIO1G6]|uniref:hypothetical protein n=1 Tax=Moorena sp. SIO1G6 TaxID=2607840 RepID=UPI0013C189A3|nr:hypothetical protein [Moorena sp. SIO1G6]NET67294.1 hypothetical protein [Moorena sp. SIO1G6]